MPTGLEPPSLPPLDGQWPNAAVAVAAAAQQQQYDAHQEEQVSNSSTYPRWILWCVKSIESIFHSFAHTVMFLSRLGSIKWQTASIFTSWYCWSVNNPRGNLPTSFIPPPKAGSRNHFQGWFRLLLSPCSRNHDKSPPRYPSIPSKGFVWPGQVRGESRITQAPMWMSQGCHWRPWWTRLHHFPSHMQLIRHKSIQVCTD